MLHTPRIALLAAACLATALAAPARAQFGSLARTEAVLVDSTLLAPTTYGSAMTYATSYRLAPTAYYGEIPSSYVVPTYAESRLFTPRRYRYRPLWTSTRFYEDAFTPSVYYAPTSTAVVYLTNATSSTLCDEPARVTTGRTVTAPAPATTLRSEASAPIAPEPGLAPRRLSVPRDAEPAPGRVADRAADPVPASPPQGDPAPADRPVEENGLPADPAIPMPRDVGAAAGPRTVQRFVFPESAVLRGVVAKAGERQPGVKVQVVSRAEPGKYLDLAGVTDADGHFAIRVPTAGDWTLQVARPGGRLFTQEFSLAAGRFRDGKGEFPSVTIDQ